jgi:hypothetical protein
LESCDTFSKKLRGERIENNQSGTPQRRKDDNRGHAFQFILVTISNPGTIPKGLWETPSPFPETLNESGHLLFRMRILTHGKFMHT